MREGGRGGREGGEGRQEGGRREGKYLLRANRSMSSEYISIIELMNLASFIEQFCSKADAS